MSAVKEAKEKAKELAPDGGQKDSIAKRVVVPLVASAASAAAAYAVRKLPALVQEKVVPRVKQAASSGGGGDIVSKARDAVSTVADRVTGDSDGAHDARPPRPSLSRKQLAELDRGRRERAKRRAQRAKALKS